MRLLADTSEGLIEKELKPNGVAEEPPINIGSGHIVAVAGPNGRSRTTSLEGGIAISDAEGVAETGRYGAAHMLGTGGTAKGGPVSVCSVWHGGVALTGDGGYSITHFGKSRVGKGGVAIADRGWVCGGKGALLIISYKDGCGENVYVVEQVGVNGIEPEVFYKLGADQKFVRVRDDEKEPEDGELKLRVPQRERCRPGSAARHGRKPRLPRRMRPEQFPARLLVADAPRPLAPRGTPRQSPPTLSGPDRIPRHAAKQPKAGMNPRQGPRFAIIRVE